MKQAKGNPGSSRRQFIHQAVGGVVGLAGGALGCDEEPNPSPHVDPTTSAGGLDGGSDTSPDAAHDGGSPAVQDVRLVVQWLETELDGVPVRLRSYNGSVPGTLITTRCGQTLNIELVNDLDDYQAKSWTKADTWNGDHNVPHLLSDTNLHVHGLDVRPHLFEPLGTEDPSASMIAVKPKGGKFQYSFEIPRDHPSGLFWYHPHHHGSTAVQAVSGMAGGIIVEGPIDDVPEIAAAKSVVLVIQDIGLFQSDDPDHPDVWTYEPVQNAIWNTFSTSTDDAVRIWDSADAKWVNQPDLKGGFTTGDYALRFYLVNGQPFYREEHAFSCSKAENDAGDANLCDRQVGVGEQLIAAPGEVLRLRILNGCSDLVMPLHMEGHAIHLIAMDGVNFEAPREIHTEAAELWDGRVDYSEMAKSLVLAPANRAEFLIQAGEPGTYRLMQIAHDKQQFLPAPAKTIAILMVTGEPVEMSLPTKLPTPERYYPLIKPTELVDNTYEVPMSMMFPAEMNPEVGVDFMIDEMLYDEHESGKVVVLNTAEEWTIQTVMTEEGHPFHIHVNHFEVMSINGIEQPPGTLMDTVWVPKPPSVDGGDPRTDVVIRMKFVEWTGKSVYHCHILPHEDTGMMQNFIIEA